MLPEPAYLGAEAGGQGLGPGGSFMSVGLHISQNQGCGNLLSCGIRWGPAVLPHQRSCNLHACTNPPLVAHNGCTKKNWATCIQRLDSQLIWAAPFTSRTYVCMHGANPHRFGCLGTAGNLGHRHVTVQDSKDRAPIHCQLKLCYVA